MLIVTLYPSDTSVRMRGVLPAVTLIAFCIGQALVPGWFRSCHWRRNPIVDEKSLNHNLFALCFCYSIGPASLCAGEYMGSSTSLSCSSVTVYTAPNFQLFSATSTYGSGKSKRDRT